MLVRPLYDRVLVKRVEQETRSKSGLFLPETAKEKPSEGIVLAIGQGELRDNGDIRPLAVKIGDRIAFGRYSGNEIKVDGEDRLILRETEILGVID